MKNKQISRDQTENETSDERESLLSDGDMRDLQDMIRSGPLTLRI